VGGEYPKDSSREDRIYSTGLTKKARRIALKAAGGGIVRCYSQTLARGGISHRTGEVKNITNICALKLSLDSRLRTRKGRPS